MKSKVFYKNCDQYTAFPEENDVFASEFEKNSLLPFGILKVDVSGVNHDVLIAAPIADDEGRIAKRNLADTCGGTWLSYSKRGNKWALDCSPDDLLSFHINRLPAKVSLQSKKEFFNSHHFIPNRDPRAENGLPIFEIGGEAPTTRSNWYVRLRNYIPSRLEDIPGKESSEQKFFTLVDADGHDYVRLGVTYAGVYTNVLMPQLHYYYSPLSHKVLVIHEFY